MWENFYFYLKIKEITQSFLIDSSFTSVVSIICFEAP